MGDSKVPVHTHALGDARDLHVTHTQTSKKKLGAESGSLDFRHIMVLFSPQGILKSVKTFSFLVLYNSAFIFILSFILHYVTS
jgi:hypothetical protein